MLGWELELAMEYLRGTDMSDFEKSKLEWLFRKYPSYAEVLMGTKEERRPQLQQSFLVHYERKKRMKEQRKGKTDYIYILRVVAVLILLANKLLIWFDKSALVSPEIGSYMRSLCMFLYIRDTLITTDPTNLGFRDWFSLFKANFFNLPFDVSLVLIFIQLSSW